MREHDRIDGQLELLQKQNIEFGEKIKRLGEEKDEISSELKDEKDKNQRLENENREIRQKLRQNEANSWTLKVITMLMLILFIVFVIVPHMNKDIIHDESETLLENTIKLFKRMDDKFGDGQTNDEALNQKIGDLESDRKNLEEILMDSYYIEELTKENDWPDETFVRDAYEILLGRQPKPTESEHFWKWVEYLRFGPLNDTEGHMKYYSLTSWDEKNQRRAMVIIGFCQSNEFKAKYITGNINKI